MTRILSIFSDGMSRCASQRRLGLLRVRYRDTSKILPVWRKWARPSNWSATPGSTRSRSPMPTDSFALTGLLAGSYDLRVSAPSFLPALREDVALAAGASKVLNITLNTLFEAVRMLPELKRSADEDDSWKWTLRSTANRPILRFEAGTPVVVESAQQDRSMKGTLAFMAGGSSEGYGSAADLGTAFNVEQSIFHTGTLGLAGDLGYGTGTPDGVVRVPHTSRQVRRMDARDCFEVRRFSTPDAVPHRGALEALAMSYADGFSIGRVARFSVWWRSAGH